MITIKPGVRINGMRPELLLGVVIAQGVYALKNRTMTITSCIDGKHRTGSLHYAGCAVDLRTHDLPAGEAEEILNLLKSALGSDFDAVLEKDHIHLEFQPKEAYTP